MCTETYGVLLTFCPYLYWQFKILTAESSPEGTHKSTHISRSIIGMKIGPFGSYIKWTGELGSIGCTFIACFFWFHIWSHKPILFWKLYTLYFPWNLSFFLLAWLCYTADCNVLAVKILLLHFAHFHTTNQRWLISQPESCKQAPLPSKQPAEIAPLWT